MVKLKLVRYLVILFLFSLIGVDVCLAQQDPLDQGEPDSLITIIDQPNFIDGHWTTTIRLYFLNDVETIGAASAGFTWDNPAVEIDSAVFSPTATAAFDLFRIIYYKNELDSANLYDRLQCTVLGHPLNGLAPSPTPQLVVTYYATLTAWQPDDQVCLAEDLFVERSFVDPVVGEYAIGWRAPVCAEAGPDEDNDGVGDFSDNCPTLANTDQADFDRDLIGDLCDECTDSDQDGYGDPGFAANLCGEDNCPETANPGQEDTDLDGIGDACESDCCELRVGDANNSGEDEPTIGDISVIVDVLYINKDPSYIPCISEADINQSGGSAPTLDDLTIGDISYLVDYLFITGSSLGLMDCL